MNSERITIAVAAAAIILIAVGMLLFRGSTTPPQPTVVPIVAATPLTICSPAWSCGRLARGETDMKPGVWYLKYDDTTGPAQLEITFDEDAQCHVDTIIADCAAMNPSSGSASSFIGYKDGDVFHVSKLDFSTN